MAKEVNLLSYWIPILRQLKEFEEIAIAEEPELRYILEAVDRTLGNMFIESADEYGIKRFEEMMGIYPEAGATLESRRFKLLTKWSDKVPYTSNVLYEKLEAICGSDDFTLTIDYSNYFVQVITHLEDAGSFDVLIDALKGMVPCNMETDYKNVLQTISQLFLYVGGVSVISESIFVTNDIRKSVQDSNNVFCGVCSCISERIFVTAKTS